MQNYLTKELQEAIAENNKLNEYYKVVNTYIERLERNILEAIKNRETIHVMQELYISQCIERDKLMELIEKNQQTITKYNEQ